MCGSVNSESHRPKDAPQVQVSSPFSEHDGVIIYFKNSFQLSRRTSRTVRDLVFFFFSPALPTCFHARLEVSPLSAWRIAHRLLPSGCSEGQEKQPRRGEERTTRRLQSMPCKTPPCRRAYPSLLQDVSSLPVISNACAVVLPLAIPHMNSQKNFMGTGASTSRTAAQGGSVAGRLGCLQLLQLLSPHLSPQPPSSNFPFSSLFPHPSLLT